MSKEALPRPLYAGVNCFYLRFPPAGPHLSIPDRRVYAGQLYGRFSSSNTSLEHKVDFKRPQVFGDRPALTHEEHEK